MNEPKTLSEGKKAKNVTSAVTPTYGGFKRSNLNTVAGSAKRIFLPKAIVQGRSSSGAWHANINTQKNSKLTKLLISLFSFAVLVFAMTCDKGDAHEKFSKAASNMGGGWTCRSRRAGGVATSGTARARVGRK